MSAATTYIRKNGETFAYIKRSENEINTERIVFEDMFREKINKSVNIVNYNFNFFGNNSPVYAILYKKETTFIKYIRDYLKRNKIYNDVDDTILDSQGGNFELIIRFDLKDPRFEIEI